MTGLPPNLEWRDGALHILDQRALPQDVRFLRCVQWSQVREAIATLAIRGAPAIGLAGAYGVALAAKAQPVPSPAFDAAVVALADARPTAADLAWAVGQAAAAAREGPDAAAAALSRARALHHADAGRCRRIAEAGSRLPEVRGWVLTHCHTGALATGGIGTALGAIAEAYRAGRVAGVYADETRPLWQGARLTAWELGCLGIPCRLLADGAAGALLASGRVASVLVGADRIAANGDVANKIGTYPLAVLAERHGVPFYVLAARSTIDPGLGHGGLILIEERQAGEVLAPVAAPGAGAYNPAFDVTPGALVTALITEDGVFRPPFDLGALSDREAQGHARPQGDPARP